jgi:ribonucleoside-diphosphate reductase alpha chain
MDDRREGEGTQTHPEGSEKGPVFPWEHLEELPAPLGRVNRLDVVAGRSTSKQCGCGKMLITCNRRWEDGQLQEVFFKGEFDTEFFVQDGEKKTSISGCRVAQNEAIARLASRCLRYGVPVDEVRKDLRGIICGRRCGFGPNKVLSCADAIGQVLEEEMAWEQTPHFTNWFERQKEWYVRRQKDMHSESGNNPDAG